MAKLQPYEMGSSPRLVTKMFKAVVLLRDRVLNQGTIHGQKQMN